MAEKDLTDSNTNDDYNAPQPPSREEAAAGAVLVASQPGSRPDALVGNGGAPQAGARLEQLPDSAKLPDGTNDPSLPPLGPGSGAPKIEGTRQSSEVAETREQAWAVSDGADVPDSDEEKLIVQAERVGGKAAGKDGIAVPAVYDRIVYEDGSVANVLKGQDDPRPDVDSDKVTGSAPVQPNQAAQAEHQAEQIAEPAESKKVAKKVAKAAQK